MTGAYYRPARPAGSSGLVVSLLEDPPAASAPSSGGAKMGVGSQPTTKEDRDAVG